MDETVRFNLNEMPVRLTVDTDRRLFWVLRTDFGLTGPKYGCGEGFCGACTVMVNNQAVRSCQYLMKEVKGKNVLTVEGLVKNGALHPLQRAFMAHDALQCGFCTPGMILTAYSLLIRNPQPSHQEIIQGMEGNLCRCGAYTRIIDAVQAASREMRGGEAG